jgi:hypothetical protein
MFALLLIPSDFFTELPPHAETKEGIFTPEQCAGLGLAKRILLAEKGRVPTCAELQRSEFFTEALPEGAEGMTSAAVTRQACPERVEAIRQLALTLKQM